METQTVPVYILSDDTRSVKARQLRKAFKHDMFKVNMVTVDTPRDIAIEGMPKNKAEEIHRVRKILEHSSAQDEGDIIVIKSNCVTKHSSDAIADSIRSLLTADEDRSDITYLFSTSEANNVKNKRNLMKDDTFVAKSLNPTGMQAMLLSPRAIDVILGNVSMYNGAAFNINEMPLGENLSKAIEAGNITADVVFPNLFNIVKERKVDQMDLTNLIPETVEPDEPKEGVVSESSGLNPMAIVFIILLILLVIWAFYYYYIKTKSKYRK